MAAGRRRERLASVIEEVVSDLLQREVKDPRVASLTSVTRVEVDPGFNMARVFVSIMGTEEERKATIRALERATGFFRSKLGEALTIRHTPDLQFVHDRSIEEGDRVLAMINSLHIPPDAPTKPAARVKRTASIARTTTARTRQAP